MTESLGIVCGVVSMLGYGLSNVAAKPLAQAVGSSRAIFYRQAVVCLILLVPLAMVELPSTVTSIAVMQTIAISILGYVPLLLFFQGLKIGKVGVISALTQAKILVTASLSIFLLGEHLSGWQLAGLCAVFAGLVALSLDPQELVSQEAVTSTSRIRYLSRGAGFALSAGVLWGIVFFLFNHSVKTLGPWLATSCIEATVLFCAFLHSRITSSSEKVAAYTGSKRKLYPYVLGGAVSSAAGTLFFNLGITAADVSVVCTFTFSASAVSAVAGQFLLAEQLSIRQTVSVAAVVAGVIAVTL